MTILLWLGFFIFSLGVLYHQANSMLWALGSVVFLLIGIFIGEPWLLTLFLALIILAIIACLKLPAVRQSISQFFYKKAISFIPKLSKTEEEALNCGDTWLEEDIFRGEPNWERLSAVATELTAEEQAFLDNETETLCSMLDEWTIGQENDLPETVWSFMKDKGFFGLVISKEYGGKGFSARAHSEVVFKIASCSGVAAVTCMVPNSLGPGELLNYYGTEEQKKRYLPKLAKGKDLPCFALTEPEAGSDATSLQSQAIVCYKDDVLGLNIIHLNKRYITLAPIATVIGLAVNVKDPDGLLKGEGSEGITCLLIPRNTKNLEIGNRHLPFSQPFMNGTIRGENIFVPMDAIIGGQKNAGHGWQMLVECLSIGRSISLPALAAATSSLSYVVTGAYARLRHQFSVELAEFEGIEERLAEIGGLSYLINSARYLTVAAVNQHKKPSVASAITKYFNTELNRKLINAAMDIHGGRAIMAGERNYLNNCYTGIPVSITVEGANIMTRNLLIFGQGSMACHPFISQEFYAIRQENKEEFSRLLWSHINYFLKNFAKTIFSVWTAGIFIRVPESKLKRQYQALTKLSHAYAWLADFSLIYLGSALKRKERLSARLADGLGYLYLAMAALRNFEGSSKSDAEGLHALWALNYCYYNAQKSLLAFCKNFPSKPVGWLLRFIAFPFGQTQSYPSDALDKNLAAEMSANNEYRDKLKKLIYLDSSQTKMVARLEACFQLELESSSIYAKIRDLKRLSGYSLKAKLAEKVKAKELSQTEMDAIVAVEAARWDILQVDEFKAETMKEPGFKPLASKDLNPWSTTKI